MRPPANDGQWGACDENEMMGKGVHMKHGRLFDISDILSVTTGHLVSRRGLQGFFELVGHILGDNGKGLVGIPVTADAAREFLEAEIPWVKEITWPPSASNLKGAEYYAFKIQFLKNASAKYGETHEIGQIKRRVPYNAKSDIK